MTRRWQGGRIQSLLFELPRWSPVTARAWAKKHGYRGAKVDVTEHYVRLRQTDPVRGAQKRTLTLGDGIRAIYEETR